MNRQRFAEIIYQQAKQTKNINPAIIASQACLETGYGQSILCKKANNLFHIEAGKDWKGLTYPVKSRGFNSSVGWYVVKKNYRQYSNWQECLKDYANILNSIYIISSIDYIVFLDTILPIENKMLGYTTDPRYREKVLSIAKKWKWC